MQEDYYHFYDRGDPEPCGARSDHRGWWPCVGAMGGSNARLGKSDYLVVESDESDWLIPEAGAPIVAPW